MFDCFACHNFGIVGNNRVNIKENTKTLVFCISSLNRKVLNGISPSFNSLHKAIKRRFYAKIGALNSWSIFRLVFNQKWCSGHNIPCRCTFLECVCKRLMFNFQDTVKVLSKKLFVCLSCNCRLCIPSG